MTLKVYAYKNCGTCRKAIRWLNEHGVAHKIVPIREMPPTKTELKAMLRHLEGNLRRLFNSSGGDYRELRLKDRLAGMAPADAFGLLHTNGNLVKRPFVIGNDTGTTGFKEEEWHELFL